PPPHPPPAAPALLPQQPVAVEVAPPPAEAEADLMAEVKNVIRDCLARSLKTPAADLDGDVPFAEYGLDSLLSSSFVVQVNDRLGITLSKAIVFDHTTVNRFASHVVHTHGAAIANSRSAAVAELPSARPAVPVDSAPVSAQPGPPAPATGSADRSAPVAATRTRQDYCVERATDIAVIGMAGQFPDADDVHGFWENLLAGRD